MSFHLTHRHGGMTSGSSSSDFAALLSELEGPADDAEHHSVAVTHESEWSISVSRGGRVILENLETGGERHMDDVPESKLLALWQCLAAGDIAAIEREPWLPGY